MPLRTALAGPIAIPGLSPGPRRLAHYLAQEGVHLSVFGVYRVLQRAGLVKKRRSRPRKKPQSYPMTVPGQRVQVDVKYSLW